MAATRRLHGARQEIPYGLTTVLLWDTEEFADGGHIASGYADGRVTMTDAGLYLVQAYVTWSVAPARGLCFLRLRRSTAGQRGTTEVATTYISFDEAHTAGMAVSALVRLDYYESLWLEVEQHADAPHVLVGGPGFNAFEVAQLGA